MMVNVACVLWTTCVLMSASDATFLKSLRTLLVGKGWSPLPPPLAASMKFLPPDSADSTRVCVHSDDPGQFQPKCFPCRKEEYDAIVKTCANKGRVEPNVSYTEAACIESNCALDDRRQDGGGGGRFPERIWAAKQQSTTTTASSSTSEATTPSEVTGASSSSAGTTTMTTTTTPNRVPTPLENP